VTPAQEQFLRLLERAVVDFARAERTACDLLAAGPDPTPAARHLDATAQRDLEFLIASLNHWKESCAVVRADLRQKGKGQ
jgi:hypothetical protein